ncbi:MAG: V-type ATP synthase subunit E [Spirochaetaceae bacterium]|jgi:V/A-type H+-transporting ATPase subunit E|nr:V-type ATP synthase subunit E [Spirochaetaceae bacterium]
MDIQLQELIDKIKKDGIESASEEALRLKTQAEGEAKHIVDAARREAADIIAKGKADAERAEKAGAAALEQASRNLVLVFKKEIETLLDKIIALKTETLYTDEALKAVLPELLKNWASKGSDSLDILLSEKDRKALEGYFTGKLASELNRGVELKTDRNLAAGFRIAEKDGSAYYDFSAESVAELLSAYLNPRLAEILKNAVKDN